MRARAILFFATLIALAVPFAARADSPLTSTPFHAAYGDHPAVVRARGAALDDATLRALRDPSIPSDVRAAIVNALGWRYYSGAGDARAYGRAFLDHIAAERRTTTARLRVADVSTEELFALAYLTAMDRYRDLGAIGGAGEVERRTPHELLTEAARRAPTDRAIAAVRALVAGQAHLERNDVGNREAVHRGFCRVWNAYAALANTGSAGDLRPHAQEIIERYMHSYRASC